MEEIAQNLAITALFVLTIVCLIRIWRLEENQK